MMETYQEFLDRIFSFEKKEWTYGDGYFKGNPSISKKVNPDNTFRNFYGDTVVFELAASVKEKLAAFAAFLYQSAPDCFCERLVPQTFHLTLHDLSNSPVLQEVAKDVFENELKVIEQMQQVQKYEKTVLKMKSKAVFNMVDTSLVMGVYPAGGEDYRRMMELYDIFDEVKRLPYPFTPHITLAYYNVYGFDVQAARGLEKAVRQLNEQEIEFELSVEHLYYQKFVSMNDYINVINLARD